MAGIDFVDHPTASSGKKGKNHWGSVKTQRTMSMTFTGWEMLSKMSEEAGMNRSEALEVLIRCAVCDEVDLRQERTRVSGLVA